MRFTLLTLTCFFFFTCTPEPETVQVKNFTLEVPPGISYDKNQDGNKLITFSNGSKLKLFIEDGIGGVVRPGRVADQYEATGVEEFTFDHLYDGYYKTYKGTERFAAEAETINGSRYRRRRFNATVNGDTEIYFELGLLMVDTRYYTIINSGLRAEEADYADAVEELIGSIRAK